MVTKPEVCGWIDKCFLCVVLQKLTSALFKQCLHTSVQSTTLSSLLFTLGKSILKRVCNTHYSVLVQTSLSGFDVTAVPVVRREYDYNTTATKPCIPSASSAPAVWLHGLSLHNCGTSTRCCMTSNPEGNVCTTYYCVCCILSLIYSWLY